MNYITHPPEWIISSTPLSNLYLAARERNTRAPLKHRTPNSKLQTATPTAARAHRRARLRTTTSAGTRGAGSENLSAQNRADVTQQIIAREFATSNTRQLAESQSWIRFREVANSKANQRQQRHAIFLRRTHSTERNRRFEIAVQPGGSASEENRKFRADTHFELRRCATYQRGTCAGLMVSIRGRKHKALRPGAQ